MERRLESLRFVERFRPNSISRVEPLKPGLGSQGFKPFRDWGGILGRFESLGGFVERTQMNFSHSLIHGAFGRTVGDAVLGTRMPTSMPCPPLV
jgi:hypothetical protein